MLRIAPVSIFAVSALAVAVSGAGSSAAFAVTVVPHSAAYDLTLQDGSSDLEGAKGRIALSIEQKDCRSYDIDYRFVARFQRSQDLVLTDQRTKSTESVSGDHLIFQTKTFIDATESESVGGEASTTGGLTTVSFRDPETRKVKIPASVFPMQHTKALIEHAEAGEVIFESRVYDGDADAEKQLTSTSVITPITEPGGHDGPSDSAGAGKNKAAPVASGNRQTEGNATGGTTSFSIRDKLAGLKAWRISESYYSTDSDKDGLPIFRTIYTLYENGVSDDLVLKFDGYTLAGGLSKLDLLSRPDCS